ncbi:MAG: CapA family protein [Anaerolineales bacterium]|nr:CapA family protein [Anaerolineales bacterium]
MRKSFSLILFVVSLLAACRPSAAGTPTVTPTPTPVPVAAPSFSGLWMGKSVPEKLRQDAFSWGQPVVTSAKQTALQLDFSPTVGGHSIDWVYALAAPFPTIIDGVTEEELLQAWSGSQAGVLDGQVWMTDDTLAAFTLLWGEPAQGLVRIENSDELLQLAWDNKPAWAIIPFENVEPRWKVLSVNGQSPIHKDFVKEEYPLVIHFELTCTADCPGDLPSGNHDPSKITTVVMTGVTAMVRATAYTMELKGATTPGARIQEWLYLADIAHVSNEVPFFDKCPPPNPNYLGYIFCSNPEYIVLFDYLGIDVVELTGDHFDNYGVEAMLQTLDTYKRHNMQYYGGGANIDEAIQPILVEANGVKFAFIACNAKGERYYPKAAKNRPGAAPCLREYMTDQIASLRSQGYIPIATFQHEEYYSPEPRPEQLRDFRMMADAGAVLVSGSQAHFPQMMEFYGDSFIHYGLGNLFFDQMYYTYPDGRVTTLTRREFIDRHVFYDGAYINTELLTAMLSDYASPIPMTEAERYEFLADYFNASGWGPFPPYPEPEPGPTPTPISVPALTPQK